MTSENCTEVIVIDPAKATSLKKEILSFLFCKPSVYINGK